MTTHHINAIDHMKKGILAVAILKINNDLERIGDLAVSIPRRAEDLSARKRVDVGFDYRGMTREAERMMERSLDALVNMDVALTRSCGPWTTRWTRRTGSCSRRFRRPSGRPPRAWTASPGRRPRPGPISRLSS